MTLNWKFRSGFLALFCGFFVFSTASLCFAEDGEPEMTQADSINRAKQHLSFGARYLKSKQYEDAETQFLKSFGFNPKRSTTARYLGKLYEERANQAIAEIAALTSITQSDRKKYEDTIHQYYQEAVEWYQKAVELDPKSKYTKGAHLALARIYQIQEQPEKAIRDYEALLEFDLTAEQKIQYYRNLITLYAHDLEDYEKALEYAKNWGELAPDDPAVRDMIGDLHLRTGGEDEALAEMEKVLELNPDDYATLEKLAGMYQRRGDDDKAFEAFEKLYQNDGSSFFLEETIKLGEMVGKPKSWVVKRLEKLHALQSDDLVVIERLADLTGSLKWVNKGLKQDSQNGKYPYMMGDHYFNRWENSSAKQDSINALTWYRRALKDPQWKGNANAMILTLDPPLTEEEKKRREFFEGSKKKKEEVETEGKK